MSAAGRPGRRAASLVHPRSGATSGAPGARLAAAGWWRRAPFLPLPTREYLALPHADAYGDPDHAPEPDDVVTYLHWCRAWHDVTA